MRTFPLFLKKYYWRLLEKRKLLPKRVHMYIQDYITQIKVLALFFGSLLFHAPISKILKFKKSSYCSYDAKRSLLMISYYSHPYKSLYGTQRVVKFIKYLVKMGWDITLLSTNPPKNSVMDVDSDPIPMNVKVIRTDQYGLKILENKKLVIPDDYIAWIWPAVLQIQKVLSEKNINVIYATAPPYSNLIVGSICSLIFDIPLVSDFRDPWNKIDVVWNIDKVFLRTLNTLLEKSVLKISRGIVMVDGKEYCQQFFSTYDLRIYDKLIAITNGFDEEDFLDTKKVMRRDGRFVMSYVGGFYNIETFQNIIRPILLWYEQYPKDFTNIVLEYAGQSSHYFKEVEGYPFQLINHGYISHKESIKVRFNANLQLFSQPNSFKPHVLSGKIYEMIRTGIPILAITNPSGAVAKLIGETGTGSVVKSGDFVLIAEKLKELYEMWRQDLLTTNINHEKVMEYSRENLTKKLSSVFESLIKNNNKVI